MGVATTPPPFCSLQPTKWLLRICIRLANVNVPHRDERHLAAKGLPPVPAGTTACPRRQCSIHLFNTGTLVSGEGVSTLRLGHCRYLLRGTPRTGGLPPLQCILVTLLFPLPHPVQQGVLRLPRTAKGLPHSLLQVWRQGDGHVLCRACPIFINGLVPTMTMTTYGLHDPTVAQHCRMAKSAMPGLDSLVREGAFRGDQNEIAWI